MHLLPARRPSRLTHFPLLVASTLLVFPAIIGVTPSPAQNAVATAGVIRETAHGRRLLQQRQTIADMSIEVDEYEWGGEGDGRDVCKRWSHQSTLIGDTVFIYGGQAKTSAGQNDHMWNSNFLALNIRDTWDTGSPKLQSISGKEAGPPPVANAYLFASLTDPASPEVYLYGGLFSDRPHVLPTESNVWRYRVAANAWDEIASDDFVVTDDSAQKRVERAAEGAGVSIPERGLGFYFGGHLDGYTTRGWSQNIERVYLKSMVELRFPGGTQADIEDGKVGFRNVSEGSGLDRAGVPERADGVLVFVPWGEEGILVGIGGGRSEDFTQLNIVDIYDIETSTWTRQATSGQTPKYRVNPCAVVGSAPDGSSHNIYFYGGQNLVPYGSQVQYDDMWILSVPSFTWIEVDVEGQSNPPARAGHSCEIWGRQMIVIGGFVDQELSCDNPGIYVFDATGLEWKTKFVGGGDKGLDGGAGGGDDGDGGGDGGDNEGGGDGDDKDKDADYPDGLRYRVPDLVISVIGGDRDGHATVTAPVQTPDDDSPLQTNPGTYTYSYKEPGSTYTRTVTNSDGSVVTETGVTGKGPDADGDPSSASGPNVAAIVGGVVGGIAGLLILLLIGAFVLYKKKIRQLRAQRFEELEARRRNSAASTFPGSRGGRSKEGEETAYTGGGGMMSNRSSTDELLMEGGEPSFWGVLLAPRRSLRVVNH